MQAKNTNIRNLSKIALLALVAFAGSSCSSTQTIPTPKDTKIYGFPERTAFLTKPDRPYKVLGSVKAREEFLTLNMDGEELVACKNFFNKAVRQMVRDAKKAGGDAVVDVKSNVLHFDGTWASFPRAECADDGQEGQVLTSGVVIQWIEKDPAKRQ